MSEALALDAPSLQEIAMQFRSSISTLAASSLLLASPAEAFPDDAAELHQIIATEYGGDANAYVEDKIGDFRRMGCRGRADLVQQLLDDGFEPLRVSTSRLWQFYVCALDDEGEDVIAAITTPELVTILEQQNGRWSLPLMTSVQRDSYANTLVLLQNGAHMWDNRDFARTNITPDGQRLFAAHVAVEQEKTQAIRAFEVAGYSDILADARQPGFVNLMGQLARGDEGGGGDGLLGGLADLALGAALGGSPADFLIASAGTGLLAGDGDGAAPSVATNEELQRRLARYLRNLEAPGEREADKPAFAAQEAESRAQGGDTLAELERLTDLRDRGALSNEEFDALKA